VTSLWRDHDLRLLVVAKTVSALGDEAAVLALTLRLAGTGHGAWSVSALLVAGFAPLLLMAPIAGLLVDRYDHRRLLVGAGSAQALLCLALAHTTAQPTVLVLVGTLGIGQSVTGATWSAMLVSIVGTARLGAATGIVQAAGTTALIMAPALGGVLTGIGGAELVLYLDAATFVAVTIAGTTIRHRQVTTRKETGESWRIGFSAIITDSVLRPLCLTLFAFVVLGGMVNVVSVFLIRRTLHAGPAWYGAEGAVVGAAMVLGSILGARIKGIDGQVRWTLLALVGLSLSLLGYAISPSVGWVLAPAVVCGLSNGAMNVCISTVLMTRAPGQARGRVAAALNGIVAGGFVTSMLLGGALASVLSPRQVFFAAGLTTLAIPALVVRPILRNVGRISPLTANE
jgi:MFS family permease